MPSCRGKKNPAAFASAGSSNLSQVLDPLHKGNAGNSGSVCLPNPKIAREFHAVGVRASDRLLMPMARCAPCEHLISCSDAAVNTIGQSVQPTAVELLASSMRMVPPHSAVRRRRIPAQADPLTGEHPERFGSVGCARRRLFHQWGPAGHMLKTGPRRVKEA